MRPRRFGGDRWGSEDDNDCIAAAGSVGAKVVNLDELASVATQFGVTRAQVDRGHLISHLLDYLGAHFADQVVFIGNCFPIILSAMMMTMMSCMGAGLEYHF